MRGSLGVVLLFLSGVACRGSSATDAGELDVADFVSPRELLATPLIVGASVSADHSAASPAKRLSLRYTEASKLRTLARGGARGKVIVPQITEAVLGDRSIVLGVDLFFWDSAERECGPSLEAFETIRRRVHAKGRLLVVGDVPELLRGRQPCRAALNEAIREACKRRDSGCRVFGLDAIHQEAVREGGLLIDGVRRPLLELVPDGLHVNDRASEYLADELAKLLGV